MVTVASRFIKTRYCPLITAATIDPADEKTPNPERYNLGEMLKCPFGDSL